MSEDLLTVDELASRLKVPPSWVYSRTRRNAIPHVRVGHHIRFTWSEVESWLNDSTSNLVANGPR